MKYSNSKLADYAIYQGGPPQSKITILGVDNNITNNEIISKISNCGITSSEIKILRRTNPLNDKTNILIMVPLLAGLKLLNLGRIFLGLEGCKIVDGIYVKQCFNCFGFNHHSYICKALAICNRCHGPICTNKCTHIKENYFKCANCILNTKDEINHSATSFTCPIFKENNETAKKKCHNVF